MSSDKSSARQKTFMGKGEDLASSPWRYRLMLCIILGVLGILIGRIVYLQVITRQFLADQGNIRAIRTIPVNAHRGMITDRNGAPLAVSTPVSTIWANPHHLPHDTAQLSRLAEALGEDPQSFIAHINSLRSRGFIYLARLIPPMDGDRIMALNIPGVYNQPDYQRYYPAGDVTASLVGLTNIDQGGEAGLELAYNQWLTGIPGKLRVLEDQRGDLISELHLLRPAHPGGKLTLSISLPLQFAAFQAVADTVTKDEATSGSMVVMNAHTGEVLAAASYPSFNPNNRSNMNVDGLRMRAITDAFEPGSVMKPLAMSGILKTGLIPNNIVVDTEPGYMRVDQYTIRDDLDFGRLTLGGIITDSSNIGMTKLALKVPNDAIWNMYNSMGLGRTLMTGFPGEASGSLPSPYQWSTAKRATLAYGYGLSASALQLASAYTTIANNGCYISPSLLKLSTPAKCHQLIAPNEAHQILGYMENVVGPYGTAPTARIPGYLVAGKTGTAHEVHGGGYQKDVYRSNFVGIVPANDPRLIVVVTISGSRHGFFGGLVAAPLFSKVAALGLRQMNIPPDHADAHHHYLTTQQMDQLAQQGGSG